MIAQGFLKLIIRNNLSHTLGHVLLFGTVRDVLCRIFASPVSSFFQPPFTPSFAAIRSLQHLFLLSKNCSLAAKNILYSLRQSVGIVFAYPHTQILIILRGGLLMSRLGAMDGITVLDLTRVLAGPFSGM
ncbi:MAG: hypothetical protein WCO89_14570, partial [Syntrophus sp. (in: bacteria)]